jgi:hypothetical protein
VLDQLLNPDNLPFAVALALMLMLSVVQVLGLGDILGDGHDGGTDAHADIDGGLLSLIGLGRLPLLMWLLLLLTLFALIGLAGQQVLTAILGGPLSPWIAAPVAAAVALPVTGLVAKPIAAIMPRDETTAVSVDSLVGREAELVIGVAKAGSPARGRVLDVHGLAHNIMLEPDSADQTFGEGERVLLVRREGDVFKAIARGDRHLPKLD